MSFKVDQEFIFFGWPVLKLLRIKLAQTSLGEIRASRCGGCKKFYV